MVGVTIMVGKWKSMFSRKQNQKPLLGVVSPKRENRESDKILPVLPPEGYHWELGPSTSTWGILYLVADGRSIHETIPLEHADGEDVDPHMWAVVFSENDIREASKAVLREMSMFGVGAVAQARFKVIQSKVRNTH